jgi:sialidase-1
MRNTPIQLLAALLIARATVAAPAPAHADLTQTDVFVSGASGYHTFRIPSVIATKRGTLLAFCEGRRKSGSDSGDIDVVLRRSFDRGKTWSALSVVANMGENTIGNPCPVVDRDTGRIWLPLTWNDGRDTEKQIMDAKSHQPRRVFMTYSDDDGQSWAPLADISNSTRRPNFRWYATGPGVGIQTKRGRLVIPCNHSDHDYGGHPYRSHVIYSDDGGRTWRLGGALDGKTNECQVVERKDGSLLINMRSYAGKNRRAIATSDDGGKTWSPVTLDDALIEPVCQASILRYTLPNRYHTSRILFANPASTKRENMTVRISYDEGATWPISKVVYEGSSAYSCLVVVPDMTLGLLYERDNYKKITFAKFDLDWLTDGKDKLDPRGPGDDKPAGEDKK